MKQKTVAKEITLARLQKEVRRMDPKLKPEADAYKAALVCLTPLAIRSTRVADIAKFTGYSMQEIGAWVENLKRNGVFGQGGKLRANWFEEDGGIAFWLDVTVALGLVQRA